MPRPRRRHPAPRAALTLAAALLIGAGPQALAQDTDDPRLAVPLAPEIAKALRAEMRDHMSTLDDIIYELAVGNVQAAADIADLRLDFGHHMWQALEEQGLDPDQILAMKKAMQDAGRALGQGRGQGMGQGQGAGQGQGGGQGRGMGLGRYMPDDFRAMGQSFHAAGGRFVDAARSVDTPASPEDMGRVLAALQEVTGVCRACHDTFRVVVIDPDDGAAR